MIKKQSVLTKIMKVFTNKEILLRHSVLSYRINLYFPKHGLTVKVDEKGYKGKNEYKEVEKENALKEDLDCKFIRINPDEKDLICMLKLVKYTITLIYHLKNH